MKKIFFILVACSVLLGASQAQLLARDWKRMADDLMSQFKGRIISVDELNSMTCRVKLSPRISNEQAVKIAENIGTYIMKATRKERYAEVPNVYVCIGDKQIATAVVSRRQYEGKLDIKECE